MKIVTSAWSCNVEDSGIFFIAILQTKVGNHDSYGDPKTCTSIWPTGIYAPLLGEVASLKTLKVLTHFHSPRDLILIPEGLRPAPLRCSKYRRMCFCVCFYQVHQERSSYLQEKYPPQINAFNETPSIPIRGSPVQTFLKHTSTNSLTRR